MRERAQAREIDDCQFVTSQFLRAKEKKAINCSIQANKSISNIIPNHEHGNDNGPSTHHPDQI